MPVFLGIVGMAVVQVSFAVVSFAAASHRQQG